MVENAFPLSEVLRWATNISGMSIKENRQKLTDLIRESLEALFNEESVENLRRWEVYADGCWLTIPKEVADPQKYKVGPEIGPIRNQAYKFQGYVPHDCTGYRSDLRFHGEYPTYFDLPKCGGRVAARSLDCFDCPPRGKEPYLLVQGKDANLREVYTVQDEKMDVGERIYISDPTIPPEYSHTTFKEITSVKIVNAELNIQFVWCNPEEVSGKPVQWGILAVYDPGEAYPTFRRYEMPYVKKGCCYKIELLGQLRIPPLRYDNELIRGFDSNAIRSMLRANDAREKKDPQTASFNSGIAATSIRRKNEKLSPNTDNISVFPITAPGNFPKVY